MDKILCQQSLPYALEIVKTELISRQHNDPPAGYFEIDKIQELITQKYYWPIFYRNVETYVTSYNVCLALKSIKHKLYGNL